MTAEEFAHQLAEYLHITIELKDIKSLTDDAGARTSNALIDFVRAYDTSKIEIGMITFPPWPLKTKRGWHIGNDEADPIILVSATGEIVVKEYGEDHILCLCAKDSDSFMDALLIAAWVAGGGAAEEPSQQVRRRRAAEACTAAAGGDRYSMFYFNLFAVE